MDFKSAVIVVLDFFVVIIKVVFSLIESLYRTCVPIEEKHVNREIVLVTGAAHGIGKEFAFQYGKLGATVICVDINEKGNLATVEYLSSGDIRAHAYRCDVTNRNDVFELKNNIARDVGNVTILINNAGIMPCKRFLDHTPEDIEKMMNVNLMAHFWTLQAFLPSMMDKNYGHVIALSSIAGLEGYPNVVPYNASKFAVKGLMEGLTEEFRKEGRNINFTTVYPFVVDTGLCQKPKIRFPSLLGKLTPKEVVTAVISAQRNNKLHVSIPAFIYPSFQLMRLLPVNAINAIHDFMQTGVDPHD